MHSCMHLYTLVRLETAAASSVCELTQSLLEIYRLMMLHKPDPMKTLLLYFLKKKQKNICANTKLPNIITLVSSLKINFCTAKLEKRIFRCWPETETNSPQLQEK